jgi:hypothetical protein
VVLSLLLALGCKPESAASSVPEGDASGYAAVEVPLVEERDDGRLAWIVAPDGAVRLRVARADGTAVAPGDVRATLEVAGTETVLRADGADLVGKIGGLGDGLTDVSYRVAFAGATWTGGLQLPPGGTAALLAEPAIAVEPGTEGPNGGTVEVVGDQRIEIVLDEESGEVRVYLLDENLEPMPVGDDTEITLGFVE